jgi:phosphatidylserine/phosphatidylglycerophosphate/cardiolipin synthase-like enzyme
MLVVQSNNLSSGKTMATGMHGAGPLSAHTFPRIFWTLALCLCLLPACPSTAATPLPSQATYEIGFSPMGTSLSIILKAINDAEKTILVAAYSFTSKPISTALVEAHKRGVAVWVVADAKSNSGQYSAVSYLANQRVPVRVNRHYAIFHHKFMVIDGRHLETGSFNYSAAAVDKNAENVLLLRDVPEIARTYAREWEKLWKEGEEVKPRY